jgi:hypothetical protein
MRYPHPGVRSSHRLPPRLVRRRSGRRLVWPAEQAIVLRHCLAGAVDRSIAKRDGAGVSRTLSRTGVEGGGGWSVRALIALSGPGCADWECGRRGEQQDRYMGEFHSWSLLWVRCEMRAKGCMSGAKFRAFDMRRLAVVCVLAFPMQLRSSILMTALDDESAGVSAHPRHCRSDSQTMRRNCRRYTCACGFRLLSSLSYGAGLAPSTRLVPPDGTANGHRTRTCHDRRRRNG